MIVPRQDFNLILEKRAFDWADLPLSSTEREGKYAGLVEGFAASGEFGSVALVGGAAASSQEARSRYGEQKGAHGPSDLLSNVEELVQRAYKDDPDWTPVLTRVGPNQWEVNTLNPRRHRAEPGKPGPVDERVVDTRNDAVDIHFQYRQRADMDTALQGPGQMGPRVDHESAPPQPDYRGRMDLPFAPTNETPGDWTVKAPGWN